jgi:chromosomal replication initiator protein
VIDGVLELELPQNSPDHAWSGPAPPFVVGPDNALLVAPLERLLARHDLAEAARLFNPLVLVGPTGSGKSHLARGVVRHWRSLLDESAVEYLTAADFGREYQAAYQDERLRDWQAHIRSLQLLVVEDVHRLRRNDAIQQELRHTIDAILEADGIVIVTAQCEPATLTQLDLSLRDRLAAGLLLRLQSPGPAAREAILLQAASARGLVLDEEQLTQLSRRDAGSTNELIGRLSHSSGSLPSAGRERGESRADANDDHATLKHIIAVTARYFTVTQAALVGPSRRTSLVHARNIVVHLARRLTSLSYAEIGRALGNRDHTTIMHADRRLTAQLAHDPSIQQNLDELDRLVR